MAAAALSFACPLRRSSRLARRPAKQRTDPDPEPDSSSSDPENELTPRALRALKRQRLALDPDGLPLAHRARSKRRRTRPPLLCTKPDPPPDPPSPEPLTPLTPLTPSPESSPSLPGHDRHLLPPLDALPVDPLPDPFPPPLDPALIPFEGLHPQFDPDLSVQIPQQPSAPPPLELQDQFHSFPQQQLYVPPNPVFVRDREINIWKLACQERVDCLLRRYGVDYIKALVESEARSLSQPHPSTGTQFGSHTKFRLYTPASYTYSSTSWDSTSGSRKPSPVDDENEDVDPTWPIDDPDWPDTDIDMEDEDEDDYEDEDDPPEPDPERVGEATLGAVQSLVISDIPPKMDLLASMQVDPKPTTKPTINSDPLVSPPHTAGSPLRPITPILPAFPPSPLTPLSLPPLSSLHVPLLSEPPRAFMGRGTPPDRRRLVEWSGSGRLLNGLGPPLYLSPVPQRHTGPDLGIVPMSVDSPLHPAHPAHTHGEWTSFLYSMLEGDGVDVGTSIGGVSHAPEPTWYELGLGSVPSVVPENTLPLPLSPPHIHGRTSVGEQRPDDGTSSSSTLRFALG